MSRAGRDRLLRVLRTVARTWMMCASAGCWTPPMIAPGGDMRECSACGRCFACPLEWSRVHDGDWCVELRCGECGHRRTVVLADADAARLKAQLSRDADAIAEEVQRLDAERMVAEVAALTSALKRDLIGAGDFAPRGPRRRTPAPDRSSDR